MPIINTIGNASGRGYGFTGGGVSKILISSTPGPAAAITTYGGYIVFQFNASATLNVGEGAPATADIFVVAGGGSGQVGNTAVGPPAAGRSGAGGNGGNTLTSPSHTISANSPIPVVVGGASSASSFGPLSSSSGVAGGSGGPALSSPSLGGSVTSGGASGSNGPTNDYLTGSSQNWAGGGGSGALIWNTNYSSGSGGVGGSAGGGSGGSANTNYEPVATTAGSSGSANTGGGGGGGGTRAYYNLTSRATSPGASGGSGVVIARFPTARFRTS